MQLSHGTTYNNDSQFNIKDIDNRNPNIEDNPNTFKKRNSKIQGHKKNNTLIFPNSSNQNNL